MPSRSAIALLVAVSTLGGHHLSRWIHDPQQSAREQQIQLLEEQNRALQLRLEQQREHSQRFEKLAETRCRELESQLELYRGELQQFWTRLGRVPHRRAPLASRHGRQSLQSRFRTLDQRLASSQQELQALAEEARRCWEIKQRHTPWGPPCAGEMTSPFGFRSHPVYGGGRHHNGCDFTVEQGSKIFATADGTVASADWLGGYGQAVEIDHGDDLKTLYAHCAMLRVRKGQSVRRGDWIATVGMTGLTSGPHCHYEVHFRGKPIDPGPYLGAGGPCSSAARAAGTSSGSVQPPRSS